MNRGRRRLEARREAWPHYRAECAVWNREDIYGRMDWREAVNRLTWMLLKPEIIA